MNLQKTLESTIGASLETTIKNAILENDKNKYPIGKIEINISGANPSTYLGFGTWVAWGSGRVPVGVNTSDSNFNTVEKTGGEITHTLTTDEMPSHTHYSGWRNLSGAFSGGANNGAWIEGGTKVDTGTAGNGQAHNNLQPYITCYMWKRIS